MNREQILTLGTTLDDNNSFIIDRLTEFDIDVFGIGDMSAYDKELLGLDSSTVDRLPFAVSIGLVLSKAVLDTVADGPNPLYLHHYRQLNYRLDMIGYLLSREIEKKGYKALPFAASQVIDWKNQLGHISHKHIAVVSGVGLFVIFEGVKGWCALRAVDVKTPL